MNREFVYQQKAVKKSTIWLLFLLFGWSYGSLGKIGIQILFYLTLGGLGIWGFVRLFTLGSAIKQYNRAVALEAGFTNAELPSLGLGV